MDAATPPKAIVALAAFVRQRLVDAAESLAPLLTRRDDVEVLPAIRAVAGRGVARTRRADLAARDTARQMAMVISGAAAPFAPTHQARMRLLRQMAASGLLTQHETDDAVQLLSATR